MKGRGQMFRDMLLVIRFPIQCFLCDQNECKCVSVVNDIIKYATRTLTISRCVNFKMLNFYLAYYTFSEIFLTNRLNKYK